MLCRDSIHLPPTQRPGLIPLPLLSPPPPPPHHIPATHSLDLSPSHTGSLPNIPLHFFPVFFPRPAKTPIFKASYTPILGSYWFSRWLCGSPVISFCPMASQWDLRPTHPFPSCFLHNPKYPASRSLGLPSNFRPIPCSAYSTLSVEAVGSSEMSVDCQQTTQHYIPEESTLQCHIIFTELMKILHPVGWLSG
jgi:hypothetical protein